MTQVLEIDGLTGDLNTDADLLRARMRALIERERRDGVDLSTEKADIGTTGMYLSFVIGTHNELRAEAEAERAARDRAARLRTDVDEAYEALSWPGRGDRWIAKHHVWCALAADLDDATEEWAALARDLHPRLEPLRDKRDLYAVHVPEHQRIDLDIPDPDTVRAAITATHQRRLRITAQTLAPIAAALVNPSVHVDNGPGEVVA